MSGDHLAHGEDGSVIESVPFPFDEIYAREEPATDDASERASNVREAATVMAVRMFQEVQRWVFQNAMNNPAGLIIRTKVACWNVLPEVQDTYTLTELAGETNQDKQSFGRWQDDFKVRFPEVANYHKRTTTK